ncbi:hypothetical protein D9M71_570550 [compost metagenome]
MTTFSGWWKRWPRDSRPAFCDRMVQSTTWSPSSITSHWVGRTNSSRLAAQRMRLGIGRSFSESSTMVGSRSVVALPGMCWEKRSLGPLWSISASSTPHFLAKPSAAWVGSPSALNAACMGGPSMLMLRSGCCTSSWRISTARRRGAAYTCLPV